MSDKLQFSRPTAVAVALGSEEAQRFTQKSVLLSGDTTTLLTKNGHETFRAAFLLLIRICENISILLPEECDVLFADIRGLVARFVPTRPPTYLAFNADIGAYHAILSVGVAGRSDLPWTVVNSDGWLARVASQGENLPQGNDRVNAIGAIGAACLGVGEVFKRLIKLLPSRGALLKATSFSFWTYETADIDTGPDLDPFLIDVLLIGCGAIGSGTAYLLSRLPVSGKAVALDQQCFKPENFGTSIVLSEHEYDHPKAEVIADLLRSKLEASAIPLSIAQFSSQYDGTFPDVILSGLDDVEPRHQTQQLWPALIIDGAVGAELSAQVSCHPWNAQSACLLCVFQKPKSHSLSELNAQATGLPSKIANDPDAIVTEELVNLAPTEKQPWLRARIGKRMCSITSEAVLQFISGEVQPKGFAPAVPFVSCFSSCMIVTELFRYVLSGNTLPEPRFQLNLLWGPHRGMQFSEDRRDGCFCVERAKNINRIRSSRGRN